MDLHVVGYCEAHHAAGAEEIIESCKIVRGVIRNEFLGTVDMTKNLIVEERKKELIEEANLILEAIKVLNPTVKDPLSDVETLARAVEIGLLDTPQFKGNSAAKGELTTRLVNGALYPYDTREGRVISERERIDRIIKNNEKKSVV